MNTFTIFYILKKESLNLGATPRATRGSTPDLVSSSWVASKEQPPPINQPAPAYSSIVNTPQLLSMRYNKMI